MKLIRQWISGDEYFVEIPFEYSSKEDFFSYLDSLIQEARLSNREYLQKIVLGIFLTVEEAEDVKRQVYTLEEWFEKEKRTV